MTLTLFGVITILISLWFMLRGTALQQFTFVMLSSLLGGSAAINLPALGGSTIRPFLLAFFLLCLRIVVTKIGGVSAIARAYRKNISLAAFCLYGIIGAMILPRVFAGQVVLVPMKPIFITGLTDKFPLGFSSQNITAAFYFVGTLLGLMAGDILARRNGALKQVIDTFLWLSWLHVALGILGVILKAMHLEFILSFFRNANYAQLDHEYKGIIRITGLMPEASVYASYGFQLLVVLTELWLAGVRPKQTGLTALGLCMILVLSTSSSAYVGLGAYAAVLLLRWIIFPQSLGTRKAAILVACSVGATAGVLMLAAAFPAVALQLQGMLQEMTLNKAHSQSALERGVWARQGWDAFVVSHGLGVGAGSFRSSSNATAILGSMGVFGVVTYVWYLLKVLKPWRNSTFRPSRADPEGVGAAVAWGLLIGMIPGLVNSPSPDPGVTFALFASMTLVWRDARQRAAAWAAAVPSRRMAGPAREIA